MIEPVPGRTPEPVAADAAAATPPAAGTRSADQPLGGTPNAEPAAEPLPGTTGAAQAAPVEAGPGPTGPEPTAPGPVTPGPAAAGQDVFGGISLAAIEADIDRLMSDKMSELDGMLAGLEELVQRLEGEITQLEPPTDDTSTP